MNQQSIFDNLYDMAQFTDDISKQRLYAAASMPHLRCNLARNQLLAVEIQYILADDKNKNVREYLASNSALIDDVQMLLVDGFPWIQNPGPKTKAYLKMKKVLNK